MPEAITPADPGDAAAEAGRAVHGAIDGMHTVRMQIQATAKRIKRLGESSQEISEITALFSDLAEQTHMLALNAAIQAASTDACEPGLSMVAGEAQRLATRTADAARQVSALVQAIQIDTQDVVAAMEQVTQGVVAGSRLLDRAGTALAAASPAMATPPPAPP